MNIAWLELANFRSIGSEPILLNFEKKVNVLIGRNNSGKSNVIRFLQDVNRCIKDLETTKKGEPIGQFNYHNLEKDNIPTFKIVLRNIARKEFGLEVGDIKKEIYFLYNFKGVGFSIIDSSIHHLELAGLNNFAKKFNLKQIAKLPDSEELDSILRGVLDSQSFIRLVFRDFPTVYYLGPRRRLVKETIEELGRMKQPPPELAKDKRKFKNFENLVKQLTNLPDAEIDTPSGKAQISIDDRGMILPLQNYGSGVEEIIIISEKLQNIKNSLLCIEEPESHLHTSLQREILDYLIEKTNNKYILATHSNVFISPRREVQVIHLWQESSTTKSRLVEGLSDARYILDDLGCYPSDLLQADFIIWVEGPTDKIYFRRWLSLSYPNIVEHKDYEIMHYGGSDLAHISFDEDNPDVKDLVQLLRINPKCGIIIDSDREKEGGGIKAYKERIEDECKKNGIFCWITDRKEIENYLPSHAISKVFSKICREEKEVSLGEFDDIDKVIKETWPDCGRTYSGRKVVNARKICNEIKKRDIDGELRKKLLELNRAMRSNLSEKRGVQK